MRLLKKYFVFFLYMMTFQVILAGHDIQNKHNYIQDIGYPYNPSVDFETWEKLKPYFLPFHHPVRPILDEIFQSYRVTLNRESFTRAGFKLRLPKAPGNLAVGKHSRLKGYLVKVYFDIQPVCEWDNFFKRVTGAQSIQQCIMRHGYQKQFKVPKKWIYPLPLEPSPPNGSEYTCKNFILVVEDMHILSLEEREWSFKNKINSQIIDALYVIITEEGLIDSVHADNIPFNQSGKICFIDTEHHHLWPIPYDRLIKALSPEMQSYWKTLTR